MFPFQSISIPPISSNSFLPLSSSLTTIDCTFSVSLIFISNDKAQLYTYLSRSIIPLLFVWLWKGKETIGKSLNNRKNIKTLISTWNTKIVKFVFNHLSKELVSQCRKFSTSEKI
jgi:hypothetical protein